MEEAGLVEKLMIIYHATGCRILRDYDFNMNRRKNLKSKTVYSSVLLKTAL
jgi:hypothetical protein